MKSEGDGELPEGWETAPVESLFKLSGGGTPYKGEPRNWGGSIPWLSSGDIKSNRITGASECITQEGLDNSSAKLCDSGTVILVVRSGILKHTLPVAVLDIPAAINQDIRALDSGNREINEWLALALRSFAPAILEQNREGTTVQSVKTETIQAFELPLPPLAEQRRIVAAVEAVLARVNAARDRLNRVPTILKRFRQSVLSAACSGRLTEDWRKANSMPSMEQSWPSFPASQVCDLVQSGTTPRDPTPLSKGVPFLKVYNIVDQRVAFNEKPQFISEKTHRSDSRRAVTKPGDVIMNIVGPPLGKVAVVPDDYPEWSVNQAISIFRPGTKLDRKYLYHLLCSGTPYEDILMETRGSAGQSNISLSQCREMELAVPPLAEQREIVRRVDALFALADRIEAKLAAARKRVDSLTQAVLAKAFRGELVPTEAELARREKRTYESAADLLARIHTARQQSAPPAKPARRRAP